MYLHVSLTYEHARLLAAVEPGGVDDEQTARDAAQELDGASHLVGDDVRAVVDRLDQLRFRPALKPLIRPWNG